MTSALIIDIILVAIFAYCVYIGARNGFVRSVLSLVSTVVALCLTFAIVGGFSNAISDRYIAPAVSALIGEKVDETLGDSGDELASTIVKASDKIVSIVSDMISDDKEQEDAASKEDSSSEDTELDGIDGLVTSVSSMISHSLTAFILSILVFALINAILKVAIEHLDFVNKIPVVGPVNITLGVILGAITGFVFLFIPVWVLLTFLPELLNSEPFFSIDEISQSHVLKFVVERFWM